MVWAYSRLYAQGLLLVGLEGQLKVLRLKPSWLHKMQLPCLLFYLSSPLKYTFKNAKGPKEPYKLF